MTRAETFAPAAEVSDEKIFFKSLDGSRYVIVESEKGRELWANGLLAGIDFPDTKLAATKAFGMMKQILDKECMSFNHIVRQWNFIGNILDISKEGEKKYQNYQIFNEVRSEFYKTYRTIKGFPAATGIGMKHNGVAIDFLAIAKTDSIISCPIENPQQINPYSYGHEKLIGTLKQVPQFERAKLIVNGSSSTLFVSGTASIIGQDTVGKDDLTKQTQVTIENIRTISDKKNLIGYIKEEIKYPEIYSYIRVYVKYLSDIPKVRSICLEHYGDIPSVFIQADVCRNDLLVEIEGEVKSL